MYGCPWQAVVVTALVGVMTFALFLWKTVLAVRISRKMFLCHIFRILFVYSLLRKCVITVCQIPIGEEERIPW